MKRLYHACISSPTEVMFRCKEDYYEGFNRLALALFSTDSSLFADSFMSTHVHLSVMTNIIDTFIRNFKSRYTFYFNQKYHRKGPLGESKAFCIELDGHRHITAAWNYIFRQGLHHGLSATPFGYEHSSVNCIYRKELGKQNESHLTTSRKDICSHLPRYSEFPDEYQMDQNGMFTRDSVIQRIQVEMHYGSARSFLYNMNRLSSEEWTSEQEKDENGREPITLELIEEGAKINIQESLLFESGRKDKLKMTDIQVCELIDNQYLKKYRKDSVYLLSDIEKNDIFKVLMHEHRVYGEQLARCLIIKSNK